MAKPKRPDASADYDVGYGKPPSAHRFKPGQSGNPKGRKPGAKNTVTLLRQMLDEKVTIHEGGRARVVTKIEALLRSLLARAFKGDSKALSVYLSLARDAGLVTRSEATDLAPSREELSAEDQLILERYLREESDK